jgi:hypothetical protein
MKHISKLFRKNKEYKNQKWLIIGKGPSFDLIKNINLSEYKTIGLNHIVKEQKVDLCHLIDFDVFEKCEKEIYENAKCLVLPINPHFYNKPRNLTLVDLIKQNKTLKKLNKEGRLFWYNHLKKNRLLTIKNIKRVLYKDIDVKYFSAEAALSILAQNNIKDVYSVGIDGGSSYSNNFSTETLLANGRSSFDAQFEEMVKTIKNYHVVYSPINASYPIRVYVGSQEEQMLCVKVLEYSIKKHTKADVEVIPMHKSGINYGIPKDPKNRQRTPFSFQRFLIPQLNNYKGRAIYVDSDMQVFQDIRQLYNLPMGSCDLLTVENRNPNNRKLQFSVMLLDCEKLKWNINDIIYKLDNEDLTYDSLMKEMKVANNMAVRIPYYWNCLEWYKKSESALVHYTDMDKQPWVKTNNKLCDIWLKDLIMAIKDGFISINYIKEHIEKGWVRPSLLWQIENNYLDSTKLSKKVLKLDEKYKAPYEFMEIIKN